MTEQLIILLEQKKLKIRNATRCNNRDDLLHLSFALFSGAYV